MGGDVIALIFSNYERHEETWAALRGTIIAHLNYELTGSDEPSQVESRFLDQPPHAKSGRVVELSTTLGCPLSAGNATNGSTNGNSRATSQGLSLRQCKTLIDTDFFQKFQAANKIEIILQPRELHLLHAKPGFAVFDMDSTLIQQEVIDELARAVGLYDQVAAITEAAMRGEEPYTDFEASLRARVALLKGVPMSIWEKMKREIITFTPGAPELLRALRNIGWKTAVLSGGFTPLAYWVKETLGLDYAFANELVSDPALEQLTGELVQEAPIIHGLKKRELLLQLAAENRIAPELVIAVGDGSNDLPMMEAAGLGVAFNAKPKVQLAAPTRVNTSSLLDILYILGYTKQKIDEVLAT